MNSLWQQTASALRDATARDSPTPGSGSMACVAGSFGLGLLLMALRITARTRPSEALADLIARGDALLARLSACADDDVAVFQRYVEAVRMARSTEAEQATRKHAMSEAAVEATRAPLHAAETMAAGLELAVEARPHVVGSISADVLAGADLLAGAVRAVMRSVDSNLASIEDPSSIETLTERRDVATERAKSLYEAVGEHLR